MALEVPYEDLVRDFKNCVVMFNKKPVYILGITRAGVVSFLDLLTNKEGDAPFTLAAFGAPLPRIGFVNVLGSVVYVSRNPVRKYYMGLSKFNTTVKSLGGITYPEGAANTKARVAALTCQELALAIMGKYPTIQQCMDKLKVREGAYAFDRQFAVSSDRIIFYKGQPVGKVDRQTYEITFDEGFKHLFLLLNNNYEKTIRDFGPKAG